MTGKLADIRKEMKKNYRHKKHIRSNRKQNTGAKAIMYMVDRLEERRLENHRYIIQDNKEGRQ